MAVFSFAQIATVGFRTSKEADDLGQKFMQLLGVRTRYIPIRLALARSFADPTSPDSIEGLELCKVIKGEFLFGSDPYAWIALLTQHGGRPLLYVKDLQLAVGEHWHRGIKMLWKDWHNLDGNFENFLLFLATRAGVPEGAASKFGALIPPSSENLKAQPVVVRIGDPGTEISTGKAVDWVTNAPGYPPHLALMGGTNSGKTHLCLNLLRQVKKQANCPILFLDIAKGDIADKTDLISSLGMEHIQIPRSPIPLNFLSLQSSSVEDRNQTAIGFRDSFERVSRIGPVQKDLLREAVVRALGVPGPTTMTSIRDSINVECEERDVAGGTLLSVMNDLCAGHPLFTPELDPASFFGRSWLIDLHAGSDTQQRLAVFLILDAAKTYFMSLPDSPTDEDGNRAFRGVIVIDEARRVLGLKHPSLANLIRLARSKGVAIWLVSQSPDDFDQEDENFLENIGVAISLRTNSTRSRALKAILGGEVNLSGLAAGEAVTRIPGRTHYVRVKVWESDHNKVA
jgi:DNA sulfur modification protein DndE